MVDLVSQSYPPIRRLPRGRTGGRLQGKPGSSLADMQAQALDPFGIGYRHLQSALRRADGVFRGHGGRLLPGAERLAGEGVARPGCAAARLDRDSGAEHREIGRRNRALRRRPALRPGADAGDGRHAARQARLLADLRRGGAARACRSASMPAATTTTRRPRWAGAPTTSRITSPRRRRSRPN